MNKLSNDEYREYWEKIHKEYSEDFQAVCFPGKSKYFNRFFDRIQKFAMSRALKNEMMSGKNLLDLGCGRGRWLLYFARRGAKVKGIDLSDEAVAACKSKGFDCCVGSITDLSCFEEKFDYISSVTVLLHLPYEMKKEAIAQIGKKLNPGGKAILIENTWDDPAPHVYSWSVEQWDQEFEKNGMINVYTEGHLYSFARKNKLFSRKYMEEVAITLDYIIDFIMMFIFKGKKSTRSMQHILIYEKK